MELIHLHKRLTNRYVGTYRHLDQWAYVGVVKLLGGRLVDEGNGIDDTGTYVSRVVAPVSLKHRDLRRAIRSHFSQSGCAHEYDCCGCTSTSANVRRVSPREYVLTLSYSRNY